MRARPLQLEELCLMYSLKYGAAVNNVLSDLGKSSKTFFQKMFLLLFVLISLSISFFGLGLPADLMSFIQVRADLMYENNAVYAVDNSDVFDVKHALNSK